MDFDHSSGYAPRTCRRCKQLKRKCDKALPKCHSCTKSHFKCLYQDIPGSNSKSERPSPSAPSTAVSDIAITSPVSQVDRTSPEFPPIYFLDFELYQRTVAEVPRIVTGIRPDLQALTEDIREQAKDYFHTIHPWIPFLSKKSFNERLLSPLTPRSADLTLLFACIKLVCSAPEGENVYTRAYVTIKSALLEAEMAGLFSLRVAQAWILLCVYEIGHAMYPSAYMSVGACAKYAAALGLNGKDANALGQSFHWIEAEERARAWWAILLLDRLSNLGRPIPSLSTEDPSNDTKLPVDDISWDQGAPKDDYVATLSTPPSPLMGRYTLMAMATSLLGRVLRLLSDTGGALSSSEEIPILDRALAALTIVTHEEGRTRGIGVCTPTVICHSARIQLAHRKQRHETVVGNLDNTEENPIFRCGIASDMVRLCQWATSDQGRQLDDEISPFPMGVAYHTAVAFLGTIKDKRNEECLRGLWHMKNIFTLWSPRWKIARVYLKLIEAREAITLTGLS